MLYYEDLSCPVCAKPFTADDDVVVCPQCGLPHHRSCWKSIGRCFEEKNHGTDQQWSRDRGRPNESEPMPTDSVDTTAQVCPRCHTKNAEYAEFCTHCGAALDAKEWHSAAQPHTPFSGEYTPFGQHYDSYSSNERIGGSNAADVAAIVGHNTGYYMDRFRRIQHGGGGGWNWSAFLLGPIWLFYRKQYGMGALYLVVQLMANIASTIAYAPVDPTTLSEQALNELMASPLFLFAAVLSYIVLALRILLGIRGNLFYLQHCEKSIAKTRKNVPNASAAELASAGGVAAGAAVAIAVLIYTVVPILLETAILFITMISA